VRPPLSRSVMPQKSVVATPFSHKKYVDHAEEKMVELF